MLPGRAAKCQTRRDRLRPARGKEPVMATRWHPLHLVLSALLCWATLSLPVAAEDNRMERTITVSATGTATAIPDRARIATGVVTEAATAREALSANNGAMQKLIAGLKESGVEAQDIQTAGLNLNPRYTSHAITNRLSSTVIKPPTRSKSMCAISPSSVRCWMNSSRSALTR